MAEVEVNVHSLVELTNRTHNKQLIDMANELVKNVPPLQDAKWVEANDLTAHYTNKVAVLPTASLRAANVGVVPSAGQTKPLVEHICTNSMLNGEVIRIDGAVRFPPK